MPDPRYPPSAVATEPSAHTTSSGAAGGGDAPQAGDAPLGLSEQDWQSAGAEVIRTSKGKVLAFMGFMTVVELLLLILFVWEWQDGSIAVWPGLFILIGLFLILYSLVLLVSGPSLVLGKQGLALLDGRGATVGWLPYRNIRSLSILRVNFIRSQLLITPLNKSEPQTYWPLLKRYWGDYCVSGFFEDSLDRIEGKIAARMAASSAVGRLGGMAGQ
jgi:hypothetical protein